MKNKSAPWETESGFRFSGAALASVALLLFAIGAMVFAWVSFNRATQLQEKLDAALTAQTEAESRASEAESQLYTVNQELNEAKSELEERYSFMTPRPTTPELSEAEQNQLEAAQRYISALEDLVYEKAGDLTFTEEYKLAVRLNELKESAGYTP